MDYRFSGHETFPCRYAWLPKAYRMLRGEDADAFATEERAMVALGLGKNMVRALRFWIQAFGIVEPQENRAYSITDFAEAILRKGGYDSFLEDRRTLWMLHWNVSSQRDQPLFAWDFMFNRWQHPEIVRTAIVRAFADEARRLDRQLSLVTLEQHFDVFLHTYVPTRSRKGEILEDNLDCPLVELELIESVGDRSTNNTGQRENIYSFRREAKPDITPEVFIYCLHDYWSKRHANELTLSFRDVSVSHGSPGQIFKLPEFDIRERLNALEEDSNGCFRYHESVSLQRVERNAGKSLEKEDLLAAVYEREHVNA